MYNKLSGKRITSIDAFRGITILVMVFVNELAGIREIPAWMKHMPAKADAMSFVDIVFPAFLFIAGMSIPFALNKRVTNNSSGGKLQKHILWRVAGLLCFGFFYGEWRKFRASCHAVVHFHMVFTFLFFCHYGVAGVPRKK